jgi:hypothetical protein
MIYKLSVNLYAEADMTSVITLPILQGITS